ncbi:MAG TPA: hypothetical protein PKN13_15385, partial [Accumulibacter sp.]|uniref:hypothetical protein n=1 Tax=Accumulibacter sp. TaxID=2053492 RepID=UPI002CDD3B99
MLVSDIHGQAGRARVKTLIDGNALNLPPYCHTNRFVACAGRSSLPVGGVRSCSSAARLFLMPECQNIYRIGSR